MRDAQKALGDTGDSDTFFVGTQVQFGTNVGNGSKVLFGKVTKLYGDNKYQVRFADGQVMKLRGTSLKRFKATSDNGGWALHLFTG